MVTKENSMPERKRILAVCIFLAAVTLIAFWQVNQCAFTNIDDPRYVTDNQAVQNGLTLEGIRWAFTTLYAEFWHPLTWLSHMLDVELFGLEPRGHHLTNLFFHLANTLLLFLVLQRMTNALWQSAFAAALFALHPLRVESVAWVAERKDVLSAFFWMLTLGAYVSYAERPRFSRYLAVLLCFALGLLTKAMLVTLPFALLLLDYWPLRRFAPQKRVQEIRTESHKTAPGDRKKQKAGRIRPAEAAAKTEKPSAHKYPWALALALVREKIPLLVLSALASLVAYMAQKGVSAESIENLSLGERLANAFISYSLYIEKMIWPVHLAVYYPYLGLRPLWQVIGAILLLAALSLMVVRGARNRPYLAVGWLWYVGTLVPVIGIVQVGRHALADRYTYLPLVGLFILVAWGVPELLKGWRYRKEILFLSSGVSLLGLSILTWTQVGYWKNSILLFEHAFQVTGHDSVVYKNRGSAYAEGGYYQEALRDLEKAIELDPKYTWAYINRAGVHVRLGNYSQALADCEKAIRLDPKYAEAYNTRAGVHLRLGNYSQALADCEKAIRLDPKYADAFNNRGNAYAQLGNYGRAIEDYNQALELNRRNAKAFHNRGNAYGGLGKYREALEDLDKALELDPKYAEAYNSRAGVYGGMGNYRKALEDCDKAIELNPKFAEAYTNRGNAYAKLANYGRAIEDYGRALEIRPQYAVVYNNRAAAYWNLGNQKKAIEDLKTAARLGSESAKKALGTQGIEW
jgi:tetratricopeptide (TPR) repeat protein